jgi:hypothetical protein
MHRMRRLVVLAGLALVSSPLLAGSASAALIRPSAGRAYPDIAADINGVVSYTWSSSTGTGQFHVNNTPYLIAGGPTSASEFGVAPNGDGIRQQVINLVTDGNGNLLTNATNSYALYGTIVADGQTYQGLLLSGTPTAFGYQDLDSVGIQGSDVFDLEIDVTGGALADYFGSSAYIRVTPELLSTFTGRFDADFSAAKATSNTRSYNSPQPFPVPEPAAVVVLLAGGLGWVHRHRRKLAGK